MLLCPAEPSRFSQTISAQLPAASNMLEALQDWLEAAGVSLKEAMQIGLMVDELVTNTITHGYPNGYKSGTSALGSVEIHAEIFPGATASALSNTGKTQAVAVTLKDDGIAFNPLTLPGPDLTLDIDEREIGGLGVYFVRQLADEIDYWAEEPDRGCNTGFPAFGNRLRFVKRLSSASANETLPD